VIRKSGDLTTGPSFLRRQAVGAQHAEEVRMSVRCTCSVAASTPVIGFAREATLRQLTPGYAAPL
jgi:hypothetical protein